MLLLYAAEQKTLSTLLALNFLLNSLVLVNNDAKKYAAGNIYSSLL
jgi:hypothetical protein